MYSEIFMSAWRQEKTNFFLIPLKINGVNEPDLDGNLVNNMCYGFITI